MKKPRYETNKIADEADEQAARRAKARALAKKTTKPSGENLYEQFMKACLAEGCPEDAMHEFHDIQHYQDPPSAKQQRAWLNAWTERLARSGIDMSLGRKASSATSIHEEKAMIAAANYPWARLERKLELVRKAIKPYEGSSRLSKTCCCGHRPMFETYKLYLTLTANEAEAAEIAHAVVHDANDHGYWYRIFEQASDFFREFYGINTKEAPPWIAGRPSACARSGQSTPPEPKLLWYAATGGIQRTGPFDNQARAWASIRLSEAFMREMKTYRPFSSDAIVWCEES